MSRRATSLGPKPSFFLFVVLFFCFFVFCFVFLLVFFGRVYGSGEVARRATSLGPKPSLFVFVFIFFGRFLVFNTKKPCFSPRKGHFCLFSVFLFLSPLAFLDFPLFLFLFPCLSLFFFSFFIPSCLCFLLSFGSLFGSLSLCFLSSLVFFHERNNIKIFNCKFFFINIFSFLVSCLFLFQVPFSYLCSFLILSYVSCSTSRFWIPNKQLTKKQNWSKGGLQQNGFFLSTCVWKMSKVIVILGAFVLAIFGWCSKKHYKNRYFSTFLKAKPLKKMAIFNSY